MSIFIAVELPFKLPIRKPSIGVIDHDNKPLCENDLPPYNENVFASS